MPSHKQQISRKFEDQSRRRAPEVRSCNAEHRMMWDLVAPPFLTLWQESEVWGVTRINGMTEGPDEVGAGNTGSGSGSSLDGGMGEVLGVKPEVRSQQKVSGS